MLAANTTFALLTDYENTYILVRYRLSNTLNISQAIPRHATNPSLVSVMFMLLNLALVDFDERVGTSFSSRTNSLPANPISTTIGGSSGQPQFEARKEEDSPFNSPNRKRSRTNNGSATQYDVGTTRSQVFEASSPAAWKSQHIHPTSRIGHKMVHTGKRKQTAVKSFKVARAVGITSLSYA